jgi:GntR family transcriptional regulator
MRQHGDCRRGRDEDDNSGQRVPAATTPRAAPCIPEQCLVFVRHEATITSTMLHVKIDRDESLGLHEQVAAELRRAISEEQARAGERLPPAQDLAAVLGVNRNTVLRALRVLRDEGLLEFRRGRGVTVAGTRERGAVVARARELVEFARLEGYRLDELIEIIESVG